MMSAQETNFGQTPSQTVGPYFAYGLSGAQYRYDFAQPFDDVVAYPNAAGQHILLEGRVFDGDGKEIPDALIEISQADAQGRYAEPSDEPLAACRRTGFRGFGRVGTGTDPQRRFWFKTVKPGAAATGEAPRIDVIVMMRGMLLHAFTRIYFSDEAAANAKDPVLSLVPAERRDTLIAQRTERAGQVVYQLDIHMQGAKETVFFDV